MEEQKKKCECPCCDDELKNNCFEPEFCSPCHPPKMAVCPACGKKFDVALDKCPFCGVPNAEKQG